MTFDRAKGRRARQRQSVPETKGWLAAGLASKEAVCGDDRRKESDSLGNGKLQSCPCNLVPESLLADLLDQDGPANAGSRGRPRRGPSEEPLNSRIEEGARFGTGITCIAVFRQLDEDPCCIAIHPPLSQCAACPCSQAQYGKYSANN